MKYGQILGMIDLKFEIFPQTLNLIGFPSEKGPLPCNASISFNKRLHNVNARPGVLKEKRVCRVSVVVGRHFEII